MKKSEFWFVLWIVIASIGTIASGVYQLVNSLKSGFIIQTLPYTDFQKILLLIFVPVCLIPLLAASCHYATIEKNKAIKITSICFLVHHIICVIAVLFQLL